MEKKIDVILKMQPPKLLKGGGVEPFGNGVASLGWRQTQLIETDVLFGWI
jgi:hypothetical protein